MESHGSFDPLPKISVFNRDHLPEALPLPAVGLPFGQSEPNAFLDVSAGSTKSDIGGLFQGFQAQDDRQQS
jgi:hypothetical protein